MWALGGRSASLGRFRACGARGLSGGRFAFDAYSKHGKHFDKPGKPWDTGPNAERWRTRRGVDSAEQQGVPPPYRPGVYVWNDANRAAPAQEGADRRAAPAASGSSERWPRSRDVEPRTPALGRRGSWSERTSLSPAGLAAKRMWDDQRSRLAAQIERLIAKSHLAAESELDAVFSIVEEMKASSTAPLSVEVYRQLLRACEAGRDPIRALAVVREAKFSLASERIVESVLRALHNAADAAAADLMRADRIDRKMLEHVMKLLETVLEAGVKPSVRTLDVLVRVCSAAREPDKAVECIDRLERDFGIKPNIYVLNNILTGAQAMARVGAEAWVPKGVELFKRWGIPLDRSAYRKLLKICLDRLDLEAAAPVAREIRERVEAGDAGLLPVEHKTVADLIKSCEQSGQAAGVASDLLFLLHASIPDSEVETLKVKAAEAARQQAAAFARSMMPRRKDPSDFYLNVREAYQRAVVACLLQNQLPEAKAAFRLCVQRGFALDRGSYIRLLNACSRAGDTETAQLVYEELTERAGRAPCAASVEALMFAYLQAGDWASCVRTLKYLEQLTGRPVDDYNLLRSMALVCSRDAATADGSYYKLTEMRERGEAVPVAALNAITLGCALFGDLSRAHETFDAIAADFGLQPTAATYTCLIIGYYNANNLYGVCAIVERCRAAGVQPDRLALALFFEACVVMCRVRLCLSCLDDFAAHREVPADWYRKLALRVQGNRKLSDEAKVSFLRDIAAHAQKLYGRKCPKTLLADLDKLERDVPVIRARIEARRADMSKRAAPPGEAAAGEGPEGEEREGEGSAEERAALERLEERARERAASEPAAAAGEAEGPAPGGEEGAQAAGEAGAEELSIDAAGFARGERAAPRRQPPAS